MKDFDIALISIGLNMEKQPWYSIFALSNTAGTPQAQAVLL